MYRHFAYVLYSQSIDQDTFRKELILKKTCKSRMVYLKHVLSLKKVFVAMFMHKIYFLKLFIFIGSEALRTTLSSCRYPY